MPSTPRLVGVVNITEDSFSDGGQYLSPEDAIHHAERLARDGADAIELGPASSHPDAKQVTAAEEIARLTPVVTRFGALDTPISIDSFLPETQRFALQLGVAYVNDIHGFPTPSLYPELAAATCRLVVVHSVQASGRATRVHTDPATIWDRIEQFFTQRLSTLEAAGINRDRLIIDPGLGFFLGKNPEPSIVVLGSLHRLRETFGLPVLISASRKSFLQTLTGQSATETGPATLAAELYAATEGVDYIRTHNVRALRDALTVLEALAQHHSPQRRA